MYSFMTQQDMTDCFLNEANSCLEQEEGRASIPTAQALMLMYATMAYMGRDRAGRSYRQSAIDLVHRMKLERAYTSIQEDGPDQVTRKRGISQALWGLFILESYVQ